MWTLFHVHLDARSRIARMALAEAGFSFTLADEKPWARRPAFLALNPAGEVPVLHREGETPPLTICGAGPICEYLEDVAAAPRLLPAEAPARAEARRLFAWFERKFHDEVHDALVGEKVTKRLMGDHAPRSDVMRAGRANLRIHMDYLDWLCRRRPWLAGETMTIADLAAAAQLSCVDHLGDAPWSAHADAKSWYAKMKSRPSLRAILEEHAPGCPAPPRWYADPDF